MGSRGVTLVAIIFAVFQISRADVPGLVEMISDYAKVVKNTERPNASVANDSTFATPSPEETKDPAFDYQDFDDLQEEDRSLKQPSSTETMMKYFNGLVSLLTLMYRFNGNFGGSKPPKVQINNANEPREKRTKEEATGKHFQVAQDRFEFPQKKFKYHENQVKDNAVDQQYQPVENYPPYNPLKANSAETYNKDDKKTSYDADVMQYDLTKNSINDYSPDVDIQQSYSYEIPYENPKQVNSPTYDLTNEGVSWGNQNIHPVYHPWMTKTPTENNIPDEGDSYQSYKSKLPIADKPVPHTEDTYNPWNGKSPDTKKPQNSEPRQPWLDSPHHDFPLHHHDFKDSPPPSDHHFEYHEVEHPMDEDRVSKKPYSYYFLGRKLWYIPLLFSVYFIIYVGALVLKSVARHKIQFPEKIWNLHDEHFGKHRRHRKIDDVTENYENAVEKMSNKYM